MYKLFNELITISGKDIYKEKKGIRRVKPPGYQAGSVLFNALLLVSDVEFEGLN